MEWVSFAICAAIIIYVLDKFGLWLEAKGLIYWRRKKPSGGGLGNALQEFESLLRPSAKYVIEFKQRESKRNDDQGEGPKP